MVQTSGSSERNAFSRWLRTGKVPSALGPDGLELKYNPWHDLADGRFTFAGAGRHDGSSNGDTTNAENGRTSSHVGRAPRAGSRTAAHPKAKVPQARPLAGVGLRSVEHGSVGIPPVRAPVTPPNSQSSPVAEFVGGVGQGLYDVGAGTVTGVRAALTTNPVTTVRNAGRGIAGMIDTTLAAEDTRLVSSLRARQPRSTTPRPARSVAPRDRSLETLRWRSHLGRRFPRFRRCAACAWRGPARPTIRHRLAG
jgi:hypothetical protein